MASWIPYQLAGGGCYLMQGEMQYRNACVRNTGPASVRRAVIRSPHNLRRRKKALPDDWVVLMEMVVRFVRYCAAGTWVHGGGLPASVGVVSSTQVGKVTGQDRVRTLFVRARVSCGFKGTCDRIRAL